MINSSGLRQDPTYKLVTMVHNCLHAKAPRYLTDYCIRLSLTLPLGAIYVPPVVVTYSFRDTISLPMAVGLFLLQAWQPGTLCDELREPSLAADSFRHLLKTRLFAEY